MSEYKTNGYLVKIIQNASELNTDQNHGRAKGYIAKFRALEEHYFDKVHPQVDSGLLADSIQNAKNGEVPDIMTIHGCRHVSDLVESLDKISESIDRREGTKSLEPQEAYLLLCAAHIHDAGNIGGRIDHPKRANHFIKKHTDLFYDTASRQNIFDISSVHGGISEKYGKDTLRHINRENDTIPRLRLLAALLRVADELSENPERVQSELIDWFKSSNKSHMAYRYAEAFHKFDLNNDTLIISLRIYPEQHRYVAEIDDARIGFFEHFEKKIDKIEQEVRYCSQYGRPEFDIRIIKITVELYQDETPSMATKTSCLTLKLDEGYPCDLLPLAKRCFELEEAKSLEFYCKGSQ